MPTFIPYTKRQLDFVLRKIGEAVYTPIAPLNIRAWCTREPVSFTNRLQGQERTLVVGDRWGDLFDCAWFNFTGVVPDTAVGKKIVLLLDVNGELCVVNEYGVPMRGLTTVASTYDFSLGGPGKRVLPFTDMAHGGETIDLWADAGCNDLFGNLQGNGAVAEATIAVCNDDLHALYYDFEVLLDFIKSLPEDTARYQQVLTALTDVAHMLDDDNPVQTRQARAILAPMLQKQGGDPSLQISAIGHAHMDLGWLWPIRETIRKGARTFATAIALMERYPDYVFGASQPQFFQWMKEAYPLLYAKIKRRVKDGRLEAQGAMWVEADTNIPGGEALVRQILYGKRFFKEEFGIEVRHLWLPDVFGYSAALPQILKKAGVDYFMTQKLSWSQINVFPHHSFHWQGIDGSQVLAHMLPEETYNSPAAPRSVAKIEKNYKDKGVSEYTMMLFGIGDGGGGPGEEHLERLLRIKNMAGLCPVKQEPAADFFEKWSRLAGRFPTWVGELYLERHEGTLTTEARNKWFNRKMELALRELEWTAILARQVAGVPYPQEFLNTTWREVLLYQFHDILPGSSIKRVYDESLARYQTMLGDVEERIKQNSISFASQADTSAMKQPLAVFNSLSWARTEWVSAGGHWLRVTVPPMGYKVIDAQDAAGFQTPAGLVATPSLLENDILWVQFSADGSIHQIYDKRVGRQVLAEEAGNRLAVYQDSGDAWDFPMDYAERTPRYMQLVSSTPHIEGPHAVLEQVYRIGDSEVVQQLVLTAGSPRLDVQSRVRWRERNAMLRTSFAVNVLAEEAACEIQFGHIRRPTHQNTTWDLARDEIAAHKWVDLSQRDYGVALLNDCKYGHKIKGHVIDLNLLRSAPYPGPQLVHDEQVKPGEPHHGYTDQCDHIFTYSLYPHLGDCIDGQVVQAGYELNVPLRCLPLQPQNGQGAAETSFLQVGAANIIVEAVKKTEDSDDVIVRLYECERRGTRTTVRFNFPVTQVRETDLMEGNDQAVTVKNNTVALTFKPFEIKTLKIN